MEPPSAATRGESVMSRKEYVPLRCWPLAERKAANIKTVMSAHFFFIDLLVNKSEPRFHYCAVVLETFCETVHETIDEGLAFRGAEIF